MIDYLKTHLFHSYVLNDWNGFKWKSLWLSGVLGKFSQTSRQSTIVPPPTIWTVRL